MNYNVINKRESFNEDGKFYFELPRHLEHLLGDKKVFKDYQTNTYETKDESLVDSLNELVIAELKKQESMQNRFNILDELYTKYNENRPYISMLCESDLFRHNSNVLSTVIKNRIKFASKFKDKQEENEFFRLLNCITMIKRNLGQ